MKHTVVAKVLAEGLAEDQTSVWFRRRPQRVNYIVPGPETTIAAITRPISAPPTENLPPTHRASAEIRKDLQKLARETQYYRPPFFTIPAAGILDGHLPTVRGKLLLECLDSGMDDTTAKLDDVEMLWDTGAHITYITDSLIPDRLKALLASEENMTAYKWGTSGSKCIANAWLEFSNAVLEINGLVVVCPKEEMPNQYVGVILGQRTILDRMMYTVKPRAILQAQGEEVSEEVWGKVHLQAYVTLPSDGEELITKFD